MGDHPKHFHGIDKSGEIWFCDADRMISTNTSLMGEKNMKAQRLRSSGDVLAIEAKSQENDRKELILHYFAQDTEIDLDESEEEYFNL